MSNKIKRFFTNPRIIILLVFLIVAVLLIRPNFDAEGVAIRSIDKDSPSYLAGMQGPLARDKPMMREVITRVNGITIEDVAHFYDLTSELQAGETVRIESLTHYEQNENGRVHSFFKKEAVYNIDVLPIVDADGVELGIQDLGIVVYDAPKTNLRKGLDLEGGTRIILEPAEKVGDEDMDVILENLKQRLNVYGLTDLTVRHSTDLEGNDFIVVEIAGANEEEIKELISKQGKFEAKIGPETVFSGGDDIKFVCRSADCSFVSDPRRPCVGALDQGYSCTFSFSITLSTESAERQAAITQDLPLVTEGSVQYINESLGLYLDGEQVDSLRIGADLKGRPVTDISISGPGTGRTMQDALADSAKNMKSLQTLMITGSLPVKLNLVKVDTISPQLGKEFIRDALLVILFAFIAVALVVTVRFRSLKVSLPVVATMSSEIVLLLGVASLIGWNLDLAGIAGILIAVGTGVDDQIIITDEVMHREKETALSWKDKIKRAFYIIMAAYFTTVIAMIPLLWAGAGLLKGFALTTILGVTLGVFVTRPAFASLIEILFED